MSADPIKQAGNPRYKRWCRLPHNKQYNTQNILILITILLVIVKGRLTAAFHSDESAAWNLSRDCPQVLLQVSAVSPPDRTCRHFSTFNTSLGQSRDKSGGQGWPPAAFFPQNPQPSVLFRPLAMPEGDQVTDPWQFSQQRRDKPGGLTHCSYATSSQRHLDQKYQPAPKLVLMLLTGHTC